jgi:hypothetical protein
MMQKKKLTRWRDIPEDEIVRRISEFCRAKNITKVSQLERINLSMEAALRRRNLHHRVFGEPVLLSEVPDEILLESAKRICERDGIACRKQLSLTDDSLYREMLKRKLTGAAFNNSDYRRFMNLNDAELITLAKSECAKRGISMRVQLSKRDTSLYAELNRRGLTGKVLKTDKRYWSRMPDDELEQHGRDFCRRNKVSCRSDFKGKDSFLYYSLLRRGLIDRIIGVKIRRWSKLSDDALVASAKKPARKKALPHACSSRVQTAACIVPFQGASATATASWTRFS